jgi:hypothetical protein
LARSGVSREALDEPKLDQAFPSPKTGCDHGIGGNRAGQLHQLQPNCHAWSDERLRPTLRGSGLGPGQLCADLFATGVPDPITQRGAYA